MLKKENIYIYGAGGHGKVICDIIKKTNRFNIKGFIDDDPNTCGKKVLNYSIIGNKKFFDHTDNKNVVLAIGDNMTRVRLSNQLNNVFYPSIAHPSAIIGESVTIQKGVVTMGNTLINPECTIGSFSIINSSASVDHECRIGVGVHIGPGAILCGNVTVGDNSFVGAGSIIIENITIGDNCIVAAGSTVAKNIPSNNKFMLGKISPIH